MQSQKGAEPVANEVPVHLEGLGKEYGHFTALKSLNLTVPAGTSLGFLGPNGAGKSTTIKIMTNLIRPSRGRAALFGIDVRQEPTHALARIGAVIETPSSMATSRQSKRSRMRDASEACRPRKSNTAARPS